MIERGEGGNALRIIRLLLLSYRHTLNSTKSSTPRKRKHNRFKHLLIPYIKMFAVISW